MAVVDAVASLPAVVARDSFKPLHGHPFTQMERFQAAEAASQSFVKGDLLTLASGVFDLTDDSVPDTALGGVAMKDATGTTSEDVYCIPIRDQLWVAMIYHAGTPASSTLAKTQVGVAYGIVDLGAVSGFANGTWAIDINDTSATRVKVLRLIDPIGTLYGRVVCKFLLANRALDV